MSVCFALCVALGSLAAGLVAFAVCLWNSRLRTSIPGPPTIPLFGNVLLFYKLPVLLDRIGNLHKRYGDIFRFYVGPKLVIVVTKPEDVRRVLTSSKMQERDPYFMREVRAILPKGLLANSGETWEIHRHFVEPAFRIEALEEYMDTMNEYCRVFCGELAAFRGAMIDLCPIIHLCMMRIVTATILGVELKHLAPNQHKEMETVNTYMRFFKIFSVTLFRPWSTIRWVARMTPEGQEKRRITEFCRNIADRWFAIAREDMNGTKARGSSPFFSVLQEGIPKKPMTFDELHDELLTLAMTGSDTVAGTIAFTLALLGLHPDWQDLAQRELDAVFGKGDDYLRPVTAADLSQLTVMDAIIKETLRLFPAAPNLPRAITEDIPMAGGRHVIPRGSSVLVAMFLMHRRPELFPDPEKFDPGRFLPGGSATSRQPGSYLPFGAGPRQCIGTRFANMEMKIVLATLLRQFRILPGSSREQLEQIPVSITAHPLTGIRLSCVPRNSYT